jgi:hypothetical protein
MQFDPNFRDDLLDDDLWRRAMIELALPAPRRYGALHVRQAAQAVPVFGHQLALPAAARWTLLYEGETLWMSDTPQERLMMLAATSGMLGHVLVAGGGLGIYPQYLRRYCQIERITIVERHRDVVAALRTTLGADQSIEIVHAPFERYIFHARRRAFDGCYVDIHPTLDPRWIPGLNWLRDQCAAIVAGPLRIWGYRWMARKLVDGLLRDHIPLLREGLRFDCQLGRDLQAALPPLWLRWSDAQLHAWLAAYAHRAAWPLEWTQGRAPSTAVA